MKNKYNTYSTYNDFGNYVDINDYIKEYGDWTTYDPDKEFQEQGLLNRAMNLSFFELLTKEERLAREKAEKRNDKIDQILG